MKKFAVIEDNKIVNIILGVEDEVVAANPGKYIDVTNGWDFNSPINPEPYFPIPKSETHREYIGSGVNRLLRIYYDNNTSEEYSRPEADA
jgi:hypothetical protein